MADKKITQLTDLGDAIEAVDLVHIVDNPSGTPINKKVTVEDVFNNIPSYIGLKQASQALVTDGSTALTADVTSAITEIDADGGAGTVSLADGSNGQIKTFINTSDTALDSVNATASITITPANMRGMTSVQLQLIGSSVQLMFKNSKWNIIGGNGFNRVI
jgi:hypothetical protein